MNKSTLRTVLTAGAANLLIALAKLAAGLVTGSSAMLAESAHSVADTVNQAFLLTSLRTGSRPPDAEHPFGYGQERYFWSLLAAVGIFVAGAGFSIFDGVLAITRGEQTGSIVIAYVVLAVSFVAEGTSLTRAAHQMSGEARQQRRPLFDHVRRSPDTTVKAALFEDTAALAGLVLAAAGLGLDAMTGSTVWDGSASIAIGLLLIAVAARLGKDSRDGLIGHAIDPDEQRMIAAEIRVHARHRRHRRAAHDAPGPGSRDHRRPGGLQRRYQRRPGRGHLRGHRPAAQRPDVHRAARLHRPDAGLAGLPPAAGGRSRPRNPSRPGLPEGGKMRGVAISRWRWQRTVAAVACGALAAGLALAAAGGAALAGVGGPARGRAAAARPRHPTSARPAATGPSPGRSATPG